MKAFRKFVKHCGEDLRSNCFVTRACFGFELCHQELIFVSFISLLLVFWSSL